MPVRSRHSCVQQLVPDVPAEEPVPSVFGDNSVAIDALPPPPDDDGLPDLLGHLAGMLGLREVPDVVYGGRPSAEGVPALMEGGAVHLVPGLDVESPLGERIVA